MNFQICFLSPMYGKDDEYYINYLNKTINEINIILENENIKSLYVCIYDLIDEYDRITKEIIIQKKRIPNYFFINQIKNKLNNSKFFYKIHFRLFRAIKENETKKDLLNWFHNIGNKFAESFVIVGNFKNKLLTTDIALEYIFRNNKEKKEYGCVTIFNRNNEIERVKNRILIGASFFITQIIVDKNINFKINNIPIFASISPVFSDKTWQLFKSLGVKSDDNFENNIPSNENETKDHLKKLIYFVNSNNMICSFEIIINNKSKRINYFNFVNHIIKNIDL